MNRLGWLVGLSFAALGCLVPVHEQAADASVGGIGADGGGAGGGGVGGGGVGGGGGGGGASGCVIDTATSTATATTLSLFGTPVYFDNGAPLPAGTYRLKNTGGCMKYGPGQNWTVHAYASGVVSWWIVGADTSAPLFIPPGTIGFERIPGSADRDIGSFADFARCDAANRALLARDFTHAGGKLGIWLKDDIYGDNSAGENGKNPSWTLSRVTADCP